MHLKCDIAGQSMGIFNVMNVGIPIPIYIRPNEYNPSLNATTAV